MAHPVARPGESGSRPVHGGGGDGDSRSAINSSVCVGESVPRWVSVGPWRLIVPFAKQAAWSAVTSENPTIGFGSAKASDGRMRMIP